MKFLIENAELLCPHSGTQSRGALAVADGLIVGVGAQMPAQFVADTRIDAHGHLLMPGLIDLRARVALPSFHGSDTLSGELNAAARSGITTMVCPPDTTPVLDEAGLVHMLLQAAKSNPAQPAAARLLPLGALTLGLQGQGLSNMHALHHAGCVGFAQGDAPLCNTQTLLRAMQYAKTYDFTLWLRPHLADFAHGVAASGALCTRLGLEGIPVASETIALHTIFELVRASGARVHLQGVSSAPSVALIRAAKAEQLPISCDVSVHNLHLSDRDIDYFDARTRLNPPLRQDADRLALQQGLLDGSIDALVSDHSRVGADGKALPFAQAQVGACSNELLLSLCLHWWQHCARAQGVSLAHALRCLTTRAAPIIGVDAPQLAIGARADLCLFDPDAPNTRNADADYQALTPFAQNRNGYQLMGQVQHTWIAGQSAFAR